jgi:hypothetical protein
MAKSIKIILKIILTIIGLLLSLTSLGGFSEGDYSLAVGVLVIGLLILFFTLKKEAINSFYKLKFELESTRDKAKAEYKNKIKEEENVSKSHKHKLITNKKVEYAETKQKKEKWFSVGWFLFWLIFGGGIGGIIYILVKLGDKK